MIKNHFIVAFRNVTKNKSYTFLNLMGLSIGLACFTLLGLWVKGELSYDKFHLNSDRIYRVALKSTDKTGQLRQALTSPLLAQALVSDFPEVELAVRLGKQDATVQSGDQQFLEDDILLADSSFFDMFTFNLKAGDQHTALRNPYSIILSESMAHKYFGKADAIGKTIKVFLFDPDGKGKEYLVTGIIEDCPVTSQFQYNFIVSYKTFELNNQNATWYSNWSYTYIRLHAANESAHLEAKFPRLIDKYMGQVNRERDIKYEYFLQPLTRIYLTSDLKSEIGKTSSMEYVTIFATVGLLVLILACINYINMSTALSFSRFKETGVRKVLGSNRFQLITQFLTEYWIVAVISLLLAFLWVEIARNSFESLTGKPVTGLYDFSTLTALLAIATIVGICCGIYPSITITSLRAAHSLKGQFKGTGIGNWLRKSLVVVQYSITITLIAGILVIQNQLTFIQDKDLGFGKENLMILGVNGSQEVIQGFNGFANELLLNAEIKGIARSNSSVSNGLNSSAVVAEDAFGKKVDGSINRLRVDHNFLNVYKMELVAGRFFEEGNSADSTSAFIINEAATKNYGYRNPADAIGAYFKLQNFEGKVIGVVKDFHYNSLQHRIEPACMFILRTNFSRITIRMENTSEKSTNIIAACWRKHFPNTVFDSQPGEELLGNQYKSEKRFAEISSIFSFISLTIAILGLFAMVSCSIQSRTKEIGIRKVLGASVPGILKMISKEFLILILIAALIGIPAGYYFMNEWLSGFVYHTALQPVTFLLAALIVFAVAWLTISVRSISAARANPVDSIRNE